jgi:metallo-beta-lactamase family protein
MRDLTQRQQEILDLILQHQQDTGMPPTRAEICDHFGFRSTYAAEKHLQALANKGMIDLIPGTSRGIRLLQLPEEAATGLPMVGHVAAGEPILAEECIEDHYDIDPRLFQPRADYLLRVHGQTVAMDCGLHQGRRNDSNEKNLSFPLPANEIDELLLSHAHIDHSGNIPQLVKRGFGGRIFATSATADLCEIMLADSGHIQEEDAAYWNRKRAADPSEYIQPLYTVEDAAAAMKQFQHMDYGQKFCFDGGTCATFIEAGHILGSACILVELADKAHGGKPIRLLYTGDLGRFDMPILRDPTYPLPEVDYLITESTYANRQHHNPTDMKARLAEVVNETVARGGKVIIPSFSVGRTQNVVYYLVQALAEGLIEPLPIFVDSPLSTNATEVFKKHPECYDENARDFWLQQGDLFGDSVISYITDAAESKGLNSLKKPHVIIASSGMCEAGRILHHLKNNVWNEANTICVVGFMAQHTLGRRIVERREELKIFGRLYPLMARVEIHNGFSAHADAPAFAKLLAPLAPKLKAAFVVHGEGPQPLAMQKLLENAGCSKVHIPSPGDIFEL